MTQAAVRILGLPDGGARGHRRFHRRPARRTLPPTSQGQARLMLRVVEHGDASLRSEAAALHAASLRASRTPTCAVGWRARLGARRVDLPRAEDARRASATTRETIRRSARDRLRRSVARARRAAGVRRSSTQANRDRARRQRRLVAMILDTSIGRRRRHPRRRRVRGRLGRRRRGCRVRARRGGAVRSCVDRGRLVSPQRRVRAARRADVPAPLSRRAGPRRRADYTVLRVAGTSGRRLDRVASFCSACARRGPAPALLGARPRRCRDFELRSAAIRISARSRSGSARAVCPPEQVNANSAKLQPGSEQPRLSRVSAACTIATTASARGYCALGCTYDRKGDMLTTYVPAASRAGARHRARLSGDRAGRDAQPGRASGVEGVFAARAPARRYP